MEYPKDKYAWSVKVGEKGQFVIPKEARDLFDIKPGDTIFLLGDKQRGLAIPLKGVFDEITKNVFGDKADEEDNK